MHPLPASRLAFKYPPGGQVRIRDTVPSKTLVHPDQRDSDDESCLLVLKDGNASDLTIGRATGIDSFIRDETTGSWLCMGTDTRNPQYPSLSRGTLTLSLWMGVVVWWAS